MSTKTAPQPTPKEMGLLKVASAKKWENKKLEEDLAKAHQVALDIISKSGGDVFEYAKRLDLGGRAKGWSTIKPYTNKKGFTSDAHYNPNNNYIGSVRAKGKEPIECDYWTTITADKFEFKDGNFNPLPPMRQ